jgi:hypothetical protein
MSLKNPVTPPGIDPENFRLVAQLLNHYATPGPITLYTMIKYYIITKSLVCYIKYHPRELKGIVRYGLIYS